jgi:TonB-dependent starch-binding outer membrane protein SusC
MDGSRWMRRVWDHPGSGVTEGRSTQRLTTGKRPVFPAGLRGLLPSLLLLTIGLFLAGPIAAQEGTITGTVVDASNQTPLGGVQVYLEDTDFGTLTGQNGQFTIGSVAPGTYRVSAMRLGAAQVTQEVTVAAGATVTVDFELRREALALDAVVVTGTAGQARRREVGNTIAQINMADIAEPVTRVDQLLQGRAASVTVTEGPGTMGGSSAIRLRGNVSLSQSNQPLIYVDGVRQGADSYPTPTSTGVFYARNHSTSNPLNDLNPEDIDRVEIIRGAAATTLYGSEAAAGVIQIFTKRGSEGAASWNVQTNQTFGSMAKFGSDERPFMNMEPFLRTSHMSETSLSVTGGTESVRYFLSGLYEDGTGIHPNDERTRMGFRGNVTIQPLDRLTIDWNTSYSDTDMKVTHTGNNLFSLQFNAWRSPSNTVGSSDPAVIGRLLDAYILQEHQRVNSGVTANYAVSPTHNHRITLGLDRLNQEVRHVTPFGYILYSEGYVDERRWSMEQLSVDYAGSYTLEYGSDLRHRVSWGGQAIRPEQSELAGFGRGLPGPGDHTLASTAVRITESSRNRVIDAGAFVESMFDLRDRYFLTVGLRVDGNSTFGDDYGLQAYPKVSGSWVVSDEGFWNQDWGDFRIRGAFGAAGRAPGPFDAVRTWQPRSFVGRTAFLPANVGNPNLGPEQTREVELGFESSMLQDRLTLDVNYYWANTSDALLNVPQLPSLGFVSSQLENIGELENRGLEVTAQARMIERQGWGWDLGFNFSTNRSEVLDTGGQVFSTIVEGHPAPVARCTRVLNPNEFADPVLERDAFCGPTAPTRELGLNSGLSLPWGGASLSFRGEYVGGHVATVPQGNMVDRGAGSPACDASMSGAYGHVPYFEYSPDHPGWANVTAWDRARCYRETQVTGVDAGQRADFFKIRDIGLALPVGFAVPGASAATLRMSVSNLLVWTHEEWPFMDPETGGATNALNPYGVSGESSGAPRRYTLSLRATF